VSVFVGRFNLVCSFLGDEKPFTVDGTDWKIVATWHYDWCTNARENLAKS